MTLLRSPLVALALCAVFSTPAVAQPSGLPPELVERVQEQRSPLRRGDRGPAVAALQRVLTRLGFRLSADGVFGPQTERQVRAFQRTRELRVDGVVGPLTLLMFERALAGHLPAREEEAPAPEPRLGRSMLAGLEGRTPDVVNASAPAATGERTVVGQVSPHVTQFTPVSMDGADANGRRHTLQVFVSPDYFTVDTQAGPLRLPLRPDTAQGICDQLGCLLPTRKLVDAIWSQAPVKLTPRPLPPGPSMTTRAYFERHNALIESQLTGVSNRTLKAGHKKDVVISPRLQRRPGRVAIYGWHRRSGSPIQPLSTVHGRDYVDYSHGIRLVRDRVLLDGRPASAAEILRDPVLYPLLSDEGRFTSTRAD